LTGAGRGWLNKVSRVGADMGMEATETRGRIFYGWYIVAASFLTWATADAFGMYTFGLFIGPIAKELGWTTVMITFAQSLRSMIGGLIGPIIGPMADSRHGARLLMSGGILISGGVAILVSYMSEPWHFYIIYGLVGSLGMMGFGGLVTNTILAKWFIRMRGRAMGIAATGVSVSGMILVPLVTYLIVHYGWRRTLVVLGLIIWGVSLLPVALIIRRSPEDEGLLPDGDSSPAVGPGGAGSMVGGEYVWTLKEAVRTPALWLVLAAFTVISIPMSGAMIHFFPFLSARGISSEVGAAVITTFAFACALVKIPWGIVAERIHARYCVIASYLGCAVGLGILLLFDSLVFAFVYAIFYGIALGGIMVLRELVWANYFGRTFLGTIRGVVNPVNVVAMAGGPLGAAWLRDLTGSYQIPFFVFLVCYLLGAFFMYLGRQPRPPEAARPAEPEA